MTHVYDCPIRWGDMDAQAHVNNAAWVDYLQEARVDYLLRSPIGGLLDEGVLVVSHAVEYLAPVVADGAPMRIELWIDSVGAARFSLRYELSHRGRLVGRAQTVATPYDLVGDRLRRLTEQERAALQADLVVTEPLRALAGGDLDSADRCEQYPVQVRWSDLDAYGHVNNVKFFDYAQEARIALLAGDFATNEGMWVVVRQDVHYRRPLPFRLEPYATRIGVVSYGRSSITVAAEIIDPADGTRFARADTVIVCTDADGRPRPLPPGIARPEVGTPAAN